MKYLTGLLFALVLLLIPFSSAAASQDGTVIITPTPVRHVEYEMPYPGILPDNPLYILKTGRDRIIGVLISDPGKKAAFDLLQSEKRFQAGLMLYEAKNQQKDLAFSTMSKGQNYLDEAIAEARETKRHKLVTGDLADKLTMSIQKQEELLRDLAVTHEGARSEVTILLRRLDNSFIQVNTIYPKNKDK